jgi:D-glutamate cyclase
MSDALLDEIRALIQRDVNNRGLDRDPRDNLFTVCRDDFAKACRSIAETPQPVLHVVTGFFIPQAELPCGETDGPLGALFLARAGQTLGIKVALVTDAFCRRALEIGLQACDLETTFPVLVLPDRRNLGAYHTWFTTLKVNYRRWFQGYKEPTHLLALERVGPSFDDRCRNMHGRDVTEEMGPAHLLFEDVFDDFFEFRDPLRPPLCTIGIGDGGNEIGMAKIPVDMIARNIPLGTCIACCVPTDHLIVAGVSNWGAYALAAGVAILRRQRLPASLFDVERERELLRVMVEQGPLVDGVTARQTVTVDGLTFDDYAEPLRRIGELLERERWLT